MNEPRMTLPLPEGSPFGRIIIGLDGRGEGRDALELGCRLAEASGAMLLVAVVLPHRRPHIGGGAFGQRVRSQARPLLDPLGEELGHIPLQRWVLGDHSPARALRKLAEDELADLIVVGSSRRAARRRTLLGGTGERLLAGAPCAVAVAPRGLAHDEEGAGSRLRVIGVGYDGTPASDGALGLAAKLALSEGAALRILTVAGTGGPGGAGEALEPSVREVISETLERALRALPGEVRAQGRLLTGSPAQELLREAAPDLDLLALGSRGHGALGRAALGSVSGEATRRAPCPVLVVPRPSAGFAARTAESAGEAIVA